MTLNLSLVVWIMSAKDPSDAYSGGFYQYPIFNGHRPKYSMTFEATRGEGIWSGQSADLVQSDSNSNYYG
jgi:hypothetical protein